MNAPDGLPIISAEWLEKHLGHPGMVIIDTRKVTDSATTRIPGAQPLGISPFLHEPGQVIAPEEFASEMSRLGIGPETLVVTYDDGNNLFGARLWWVLRYYGHDRVRVLDGGWSAWVAAGRPVSGSSPSVPDPATFQPRTMPELLAETADVRAAMDNPGVQLLDVRGDSECLRQTPNDQSMAGHIPGALHLVWTRTINPDTHLFYSIETLTALFTEAGLTQDADIIVYCQGGIRAAHTVLALSLAGFTKAKNYEGSWAQWSREKMPAVVETDC